MGKRQFRIGELASALKVQKYVIRFWEKEFGLSSTRSEGGQRFYTADDLATFAQIKRLLYEEGFTIAGARQKLQSRAALKNIEPARSAPEHTIQAATSPVDDTKLKEIQEEAELWKKRFFELKDQLIEIKKQVLSSR
jgi:DNA-binding transcriptional MerR regulator